VLLGLLAPSNNAGYDARWREAARFRLVAVVLYHKVITLTSSRRIMGPHFVNSLATQLGAWVVASFIVTVNGYAKLLALMGEMHTAPEVLPVESTAGTIEGGRCAARRYLVYVAAAQHLSDQPWAIAGVACAAAMYLSFVGWLVVEPQRRERREAARSEQIASGRGVKAPLLNGQQTLD
jgi:hypothetical protein